MYLIECGSWIVVYLRRVGDGSLFEGVFFIYQCILKSGLGKVVVIVVFLLFLDLKIIFCKRVLQ